MSNLNDTIWCEKYRASTVNELILPSRLITYFNNILENPMQFPNMMFHSTGAGLMKTSAAEALAKDLCKRYKTQYKKINSAQDGNKETIKDEIIEWGSYNGYSKAPKIVILDETDKSNAKTFLDPLLSTLETLNNSVRFIMTSNSLQNFSEYSESRVEVFDFTPQSQDESREVMVAMYNRLRFICENEKVKFEDMTLKKLIRQFFPDYRKIMTRMYSCYLRYGEISGTDFNNKSSFDKYSRLKELLLSGDFLGSRSMYCSMPPDNDIFSALMNDLVMNIQDPVKQMKVVCSIRKHMIPHNTVIDKEINIASMFAEIIMILKTP